MAQLNHLNLAVSDVRELARFFQAGLEFRLEKMHPSGNFALLYGDDGFLLVVIYDKNAAIKTYPAPFHVGFLVSSEEEVRRHHARIVEAGFDAPAPGIL